MVARWKWSLRGAPPNVDQPSDYACPGSCASFLGVPKNRQSVKPCDISHPLERPMVALRCISAGVIGQLGYAILSFLAGRKGATRKREEDEERVG